MEPGTYTISMDEYLMLDALSSGLCHTLLSQSPAHARFQQLNPTQANGAMDVGTVVHRLLLEGSEDGIALVDAKDWRTKAAREARDEARARGQTAILGDDMGEIRAMAETARSYIASSELRGIFTHGYPEQTIVWQEGSLLCKARPDWLTHDRKTILHFKTTQGSAQPESFIRGPLISMGYDVAAAFYERGLIALDGYQRQPLRSVFLVQECSAPYACSLIALAPSMQEIAIGKVEHALKVWRECMTLRLWPSYPRQICYAEPRPWQVSQAAERALSWGDEELYERLSEIAGGIA